MVDTGLKTRRLEPEVLLAAGDCFVEVEHRPEEGGGSSPPPKVTRKRRRWLGRERAWDESRWDFYMRFWRYSARWKKMTAAAEPAGSSEEADDDDRTLVNSSDDADADGSADDYKRRRCFEKLCRAYGTYCKRFERG